MWNRRSHAVRSRPLSIASGRCFGPIYAGRLRWKMAHVGLVLGNYGGAALG